MITSVEIKNFKSIKSLSFDLPKFAVLVGPNGSGKTNIVQAMELFGEVLWRGTTDPVRERGWEQILRRGKRPARGGLTLSMKSDIFSEAEGPRILLSARITLDASSSDDSVHVQSEEVIAESTRSRLCIAMGTSGFKLEVGTDPRLWKLFVGLPLASKDPATAEKEIKAAYQLASAKDNTDPSLLRILNRVRFAELWLHLLALDCQVSRFRLDASALRGDSTSRETATGLLGPSGEGLAAAVDKLRGRGKEPAAAFQRVLGALQEVYPRIEDVRTMQIPPGRLALLFQERGIGEYLGQANVSDGVLHALALLVMLEGRRKGDVAMLAIEEPENAIHPWSVRSMLERAQASSRQILVTTHSETVVNAVKDPGALFIVENDDKKGTIVTPARDREAALDTILAESGQKLGDVWMGGSLGGVPGR